MGKFIALVGMCGSGKSVISDELVRLGFGYFRFGQITMDIIKERGLEVNESNEKFIRESVRKEHGMGAYAILNLSKITNLLKEGNVIGDGLYSWTEYKILKEKFGDDMLVLCVYAPPKVRYQRLVARSADTDDGSMRNRSLTQDKAQSRDFAEIENIEKGGPIAMADFTVVNTGTVDESLAQLHSFLNNEGLL